MAEFAHQLVAMAEYYKFDGWLVNIENNIHVGVVVYFILLACFTILLPSAYVAGKTVHVAVPLDDWDAKCYAKVKGHLV